jgi:hypothetical protein
MYHLNGCRYGFFVKRNTWGRIIAKIIEIDGVVEGDRIKGRDPYYNNPKVKAEFYRVEGARYISNPIDYCISDSFDNVNEISCPGTWAYSMYE